jgi:hypothetical protein
VKQVRSLDMPGLEFPEMAPFFFFFGRTLGFRRREKQMPSLDFLEMPSVLAPQFAPVVEWTEK